MTWKNRIVGEGEEAPDQLLAHPENWRIHPSAQQESLAGVLSEVGWVQRVIVNRRTGHVLDGHLRIALALRHDAKTVPVVYVDVDENEERLILAALDPIAAMAGTDGEKLRALVASVEVQDAAVRQMLADLAKKAPVAVKGGQTDPDDVPPVPETAVTQPGDLWVLGAHRLLCGDSAKAEDVARLMEGATTDGVCTDPPYGMGLDTDWSDLKGSMRDGAHGTRGKRYDRVIGDDGPFDPTPIFDAFGYCREMFLFGADYYAEKIPQRTLGSWLVWDKRKPSQSEAIGSEFELCWSRQKHKRRVLRHDWFGFLSQDAASEARNRVHPTQKPSTLIADIIEQWIPGQLVADPYAGSGTTIIAAEKLSRRCYAMEIEPKYCDVACRRWENFTGQKAERIPAAKAPAPVKRNARTGNRRAS